MSTHQGKEGVVKIGANAIGKITGWNFTESSNIVPDNTLDDDWENNQAGRKKWSGSLSCNWNPADTNGQNVLLNGASVTLDMYGNGEASGDTKWSGDVIISEVSRDWADDAMITVSFSFVGNGALTQSTIA